MRGFILSALILTALDAVVSSAGAAARASFLLSIPTSVVTYIVSPTKPAIPDLRKKSTAAGADNPFAASLANSQAISATWSTQAQPPASAPGVQSTAQYLLGVNA